MSTDRNSRRKRCGAPGDLGSPATAADAERLRALPAECPAAGVEPPGGWDAPIPEVVGDLSDLFGPDGELPRPDADRGRARLSRISRALRLEHYDALGVIGQHPFLPFEHLAWLIDDRPVARRVVDDLVSDRLVRVLGADEAPGLSLPPGLALSDPLAPLEPLELTRDGARLAADQEFLTIAEAVRLFGYAGGGPEAPFGRRADLLADPARTVAAHGVFVRLAQDMEEGEARGRADGRLLGWTSRTSCRAGRADPDGYGLYRVEESAHDFFLRLDLGTTPDDALRRTFEAYHAYRSTGAFRRATAGTLSDWCHPAEPRFPTVLVVAPDERVEARVAAAARAADAGKRRPLAVAFARLGAFAGGLLPPRCTASRRRRGFGREEATTDAWPR